jgi:hypothetical protein
MQRNIYGMHLPIRQMMERKIVASVSVDLMLKQAYLWHIDNC